jgi:hypothetical protein
LNEQARNSDGNGNGNGNGNEGIAQIPPMARFSTMVGPLIILLWKGKTAVRR